jgi:hypothetical protein
VPSTTFTSIRLWLLFVGACLFETLPIAGVALLIVLLARLPL